MACLNDWKRVSVSLIVSTLVLERTFDRLVAAASLQVAQRGRVDQSICYIHLADGKLMDLREICGKPPRDRPRMPIPTSPSDAADAEDRSNEQSPQPSQTVDRSAPTNPVNRATTGTSTPMNKGTAETPTNTPPTPSIAPTTTLPGSQPTLRSIPQSNAPSGEKRDD